MQRPAAAARAAGCSMRCMWFSWQSVGADKYSIYSDNQSPTDRGWSSAQDQRWVMYVCFMALSVKYLVRYNAVCGVQYGQTDQHLVVNHSASHRIRLRHAASNTSFYAAKPS